MTALDTVAPVTQAPPSGLRRFWADYSVNRGAVLGLIVVVALALAALLAPWISPHDPIQQFRDVPRLPPAWSEGGDWRFPLGTDPVGRDMLSRILHGARISLLIGLSVMVVSCLAGIVIGLTAAFRPGFIDSSIMRLMDVISAIPTLVLAILMIAILGPSLINTIAAVTVVYLPRYVRVVRASALTELAKDHVMASRIAGVPPIRLALRNVLPNCMAPLTVQAALGMSDAILEAAALGFLGLGAQPPTPEWGSMLGDAREFIRAAWWIVTWPGLAILITVIAINLVSDGLRDAFDPRLKKG